MNGGVLSGRRIVITRGRSQASAFRSLLENKGAIVLEVPTIEIRPRPAHELDRAIEDIGNYDWVLFTSANGADILLCRMQETGKTGSLPRIGVIGPATARKVEEFDYTVALPPGTYQAEGLLESLVERIGEDLSNLRFLLPRASRAREILPRELRRRGAAVTVLPVYDTVLPAASRDLFREALRKSPDLVAFTSSSTVRNFLQLAAEAPKIRQLQYAAIGPITAATAREQGLQVALQAEKSDIPHLVGAIIQYFSSS